MKKIDLRSLRYDVLRAKEMEETLGGGISSCLYCGRSTPNGSSDCGMCRPRCYLCGLVIDPRLQHYCSGDGRF